MAAKAKATTEPAEEPVAQPEAHPSGWAHDWRNPDAKFAKDDHCVDAEFARAERAAG